MKGLIYKKLGNGETLNAHTPKEYAELDAANYNQTEGNLNLEDGYDCSICKNKGDINIVDENNLVVSVSCPCMKTRRILRRLKNCGISKAMLDHYTLDNYNTDKEWNASAYGVAISWINEINKNNHFWLYISGITGSGKTHLCVGALQVLIKTGKYTAEYMNWNEDIVKLLSMSKSFDTEEYDAKLKRLQEVDILYIDDFLKLTNPSYMNDSISMAFRILDARYRNDKITIISSEFSPERIFKMDTAISGRINEKTKNGLYIIDFGNDKERNYRFTMH